MNHDGRCPQSPRAAVGRERRPTFRRANWSERTGMLAGRYEVARLKPRATLVQMCRLPSRPVQAYMPRIRVTVATRLIATT